MKFTTGFVNRMDAKVGAVVRERGFCLRCGTSQMLTAAHIERRRFYPTRWDPNAILCLCLPCHTWFDTERSEARAWLVEQIGEEAVDAIHVKSRGPWPTRSEVESYSALWSVQTGSPLPGGPASGPLGTDSGLVLGSVPQAIIGRGK